MSLASEAIVVVVLFGLLLLGALAVFLGTVKKSKWGINLDVDHCPRCGAEQPRVRKPANFHQAMWGGSTCAQCGVEHDKWGRAIGPD